MNSSLYNCFYKEASKPGFLKKVVKAFKRKPVKPLSKSDKAKKALGKVVSRPLMYGSIISAAPIYADFKSPKIVSSRGY